MLTRLDRASQNSTSNRNGPLDRPHLPRAQLTRRLARAIRPTSATRSGPAMAQDRSSMMGPGPTVLASRTPFQGHPVRFAEVLSRSTIESCLARSRSGPGPLIFLHSLFALDAPPAGPYSPRARLGGVIIFAHPGECRCIAPRIPCGRREPIPSILPFGRNMGLAIDPATRFSARSRSCSSPPAHRLYSRYRVQLPPNGRRERRQLDEVASILL